MWANNYSTFNLKTAVAVTTDASGALTPDTATYASLARREMKFIWAIGAMTTCTSLTLTITECNTTDGSYSAPANGTTSVTFSTTAGGIKEQTCRIDKRYVKCNWDAGDPGNYSVILGCIGEALDREAS